jgi:putative heme-binding domain-containing protein
VGDLFEHYLPATGERKLGSSPRPKSILSRSGDAARGEQLFWSEAVNCGKCHQVDGRGTAVGPDLSAIGTQRPREDLLESLLFPSRRVEPKFASHIVLLHDGRAIAGLLVKRDSDTIVLRDGQGKEVILAASDVQKLQPSRLSLMPEGQLAGLTAQEAADLLAYLATRRREALLGSP